MRVPPSRTMIPLVVVVALVAGSALIWWTLRPRPTLEGVPRQIASGRFRAAEIRLREYLQVNPQDETARLMLARVLVDRSEPDAKLALKLLDGVKPSTPHLEAVSRAIEGDAYFLQRRYEKAEPAWLEALRLEPGIAEVGWKLLGVYAIQGRQEDSSRLALRLFDHEPDPHDRVQLLLQLLRNIAHPIEPGSIIHELEPIVRKNPSDYRSALSLGRAMIRNGRQDEGLQLFRKVVQSHKNDVEVWSSYFSALMETGSIEELSEHLETLPPNLAGSPRLELAKGWMADQRRDLPEAVRAYRRALEDRPTDHGLAYRFGLILRQAGKLDELAELSPRLDAVRKFPVVAQNLFDQLTEMPDLGLKSHPEILAQAAEALDQIGRKQEASAWRSLIAGGMTGTSNVATPPPSPNPAP